MCVLANLEYLSILFCTVLWTGASGFVAVLPMYYITQERVAGSGACHVQTYVNNALPAWWRSQKFTVGGLKSTAPRSRLESFDRVGVSPPQPGEGFWKEAMPFTVIIYLFFAFKMTGLV